GSTQRVDIGFLRRFCFSPCEHAARDLRRLVVDEAAAEWEVVPRRHLPTTGEGQVNEMRPFRPDDEVGRLYITVSPSLGVEVGKSLNPTQRQAGIRFDGRVLSTAGRPQPVQVESLVPWLEVPSPVLPFAVREVREAEAVQHGTLACGCESGPWLGGPVSCGFD